MGNNMDQAKYDQIANAMDTLVKLPDAGHARRASDALFQLIYNIETIYTREALHWLYANTTIRLSIKRGAANDLAMATQKLINEQLSRLDSIDHYRRMQEVDSDGYNEIAKVSQEQEGAFLTESPLPKAF